MSVTTADATRVYVRAVWSEDGLSKTCTECGVMKPLSEYYLRLTPSKKRQPMSRCKACNIARVTPRNQAKTPAERKTANLWTNYRLTPEAYEALIKDGCAICGTHEDLAVDHDHACCPGRRSCGKCVRGALCRVHNIGEGCFTDDELWNLLAYRLRSVDVLGSMKEEVA